MDNIFITSKSKSNLSGLYYEIETDRNNYYTYHLNVSLTKGDFAYICHGNSDSRTEFLTKKNIVNRQSNKIYDVKLKGTGKKINFGILFPNKNTEYECTIHNLYVRKDNISVITDSNLIKRDVVVQKISQNGGNGHPQSPVTWSGNMSKVINIHGIKQLCIAESLYFIDKKKIMQTYGLLDADDENLCTLFMGLFNQNDIDKYKKIKGKKIIIWFNGMLSETINSVGDFGKNTVHYSYRSNTYFILSKKNIKSEKINLEIEEYSEKKESLADKILIFDGYNKNDKSRYSTDVYENIKSRLYDYEYIYSSDHNQNTLKRHILDCSIGIFLSKGKYDDSEIDMINTMKSRNCIVIKNILDKANPDNDISWDNIANIEQIVRYRNIYKYNESIKKYKKILFVCTDYPGWGGAATNTYDLIKWYKNDQSRKIYGLFIHNDPTMLFSENSDDYIVCSKNKINYNRIKSVLDGNPDLIILRNYTDASILNNFNCEKHFMIPGIFKQNMDDFWYNMSTDKLGTYINNQILKTMEQCNKCYTNSYDTKQILLKNFKKKTELLHFNYIPYYKKYTEPSTNINNREYDIGVIVSDFTRKIKNVDLINKIFGQFSSCKKIVIGKNNHLIRGDNIEYHDIMDHDKIIEYCEKIKLVINTSFYESCSNVIIEAKYQGCETAIIHDKNYTESVEYIGKILNKNIVKSLHESVVPENIGTTKTDLAERVPEKSFFPNTRKILIISTQYPYYGGAATLAYKMHTNFLHNKIESHCLFIHNEEKCSYNPNNLPDVYICKLCNKYRDQKECNEYYKHISSIIGKPDIIVGLNYISPVIGKYMFPDVKTFYYITGSKYITGKGITAVEYVNKINRDVDEIDSQEILCLNICDYFIPNSNLTLNIYSKLYPEYNIKSTKVISFETLSHPLEGSQEISRALCTQNDNKCTDTYNRMYDIAVVSSRFDRGVKNIDLINKIFGDARLKMKKKICVGIDSNKYVPKANMHFGKQDYGNTLSILSKCKILLITSKYESYCLTQLDGIKCGCIVISNVNVGSSNILDDYYVQDNFVSENWVDKILLVLSNYPYHKSIYKAKIPMMDIKLEIEYMINHNRENLERKNILFLSIDKPYNGGCSTNTYNIIKEFQNDAELNPIGLFISNDKTDDNVNPKNLRNIHHVTYDKNIENFLLDKLKLIELNCGKIDTIFVKNYKVLACVIWLKRKVQLEWKILFSPSGLRSVGNDGVIANNRDKIIFDENMNLYDFINKNDQALDNYVYYNCDCIVPNSSLTYGIINDKFSLGTKIWHPCDITYIDYKDISTIDYSNRLYDVAFICFSWKRKVKNYPATKEIIHVLCRKYGNKKKILVIGQDQIKMNYENVTQINKCSNDEILKYLNNTKILCIPSLFDSSPNVLKEALMNKCKIVLSKNVGMFEIIPNQSIVNNIESIDEWIQKIEHCMENNWELKYFNPYLIKNQLKTLIISYSNVGLISMRNIMNESGVGIYKLPPEWDNVKIFKSENTNYISTSPDTNNMMDTIQYDIYYKLFTNNCVYPAKYFHYILTDPLCKKTECVQPYLKYPYMSQNTYIWKISSPKDLEHFMGAKYYFLRGNYYNIYSHFADEKSKSILYPATSLIYNANKKLASNKTVKHKFDFVLYDDTQNKKLWENMFINSNLIHFIKPVESIFIYKNGKRSQDFIYVATELQKTKNRDLFIKFLDYCENNKMNINVTNVGKMEYSLSNLKYVSIIHYDRVSPNTLVELYNSAKINLILSGRDAYPRVLAESLACGCYNVALDTLSDGKYIYDGFLGTMLHYPNINKIYDKNTKSVCYEPNKTIFDDIYEFKNKNYDHENISIKYKNMSKYELNISQN